MVKLQLVINVIYKAIEVFVQYINSIINIMKIFFMKELLFLIFDIT